jgi:stage III sporulation protein AG
MNQEKIKTWQKRAGEFLQKYKLAFFVLLLGLVLLLLPQKKKDAAPAASLEPVQTQTAAADEERLAALLGQMDGVGRVSVMLSIDSSEQSVYQSDSKSTSGQSGTSQEHTTVLTSQSGSGQEPVVIKKIYPTYRGAVIVCQGAGSAAVRLAVIQAVSGLTGLGSDQIAVVKMKDQ